jgi:hypothetical protein
MSDNTWPIIVGGCHRSGTSLVRRLLNAHSRIYCGPEVKFFQDFYGDYVNDPVRHARFFASAQALLPQAELLEVFGQAYVTLQARAARRAGKLRWADKNPGNVLHLADWGRLLGDNWFFVHVVRNPLDTLASIKESNFPVAIPADFRARIAFYRRYTEAGLDFSRAHPGRSVRLRYEDLVRSPRATLEDFMQRLGEAWEPAQLQFNATHHQPGLEDPKIASTTGIHADSLCRWPIQFTPGEASAIWRQTEDLWCSIAPDVDERQLLDAASYGGQVFNPTDTSTS